MKQRKSRFPLGRPARSTTSRGNVRARPNIRSLMFPLNNNLGTSMSNKTVLALLCVCGISLHCLSTFVRLRPASTANHTPTKIWKVTKLPFNRNLWCEACVRCAETQFVISKASTETAGAANVGVDPRLKCQKFEAMHLSILSYGCEIWHPNPSYGEEL